MNLKPVICLGAAALLLGGCIYIPSMHPYYTIEDIRFDPEMIGTWSSGEEDWVFEQAEDQNGRRNYYRLTIVDDGQPHAFRATLFTLDQHRFLDLYPEGLSPPRYEDEKDIELFAAAVFPGHLVLHITGEVPQLNVALMDFDWVNAYVNKWPSRLSPVRGNSRVLLRAKTKRLQRFLRKYVDSGELFSEYSEMTRQISGS